MFVRLYTGDDGQSHFEDLDYPAEEVTAVALRSNAEMFFRHLNETRFTDWHVANPRRYSIILSGEVEATVGDGTSRMLRVGDVVLQEDTTGRGHTTKIVSLPYVVANIPLPEL